MKGRVPLRLFPGAEFRRRGPGAQRSPERAGSAMLRVLLPALGMVIVLRDASAQTVTQPDAQVAVSEGAAAELRCSYSQGTALYLFWYVQYPGQGPQLLLKYISGDARVPGIRGFEAEFKKSESSFHLRKASVQGSDAARYFCAVTATAPGPAGGAGHKPPEMLGRRNASERLCKSKEPGALPAEAPRDSPGPHGSDALLVVGWGRCPGEF
ncbi:T cell receptor alpha variable 8-3 [Oryctolagus cuniculus]|uniref:T cell receptor alpha variable 8-3 n=1 Tax=Oryctolagus cuniculus TaxID=9986 RepID=UPI00387A3BBF